MLILHVSPAESAWQFNEIARSLGCRIVRQLLPTQPIAVLPKDYVITLHYSPDGHDGLVVAMTGPHFAKCFSSGDNRRLRHYLRSKMSFTYHDVDKTLVRLARMISGQPTACLIDSEMPDNFGWASVLGEPVAFMRYALIPEHFRRYVYEICNTNGA